MRRSFVGIALLSGAFGALVACAATGAQDSNGEPSVDPGDAGATVLGDAQAAPVDATDEGFGQPQVCSPAGWCTTELPSNALEVRDVWPVGDRAFAFAYDADLLRTGVLEWDAIGGWKSIEFDLGVSVYDLPMNVWAPDENEVFIAVASLSGAFSGGGSLGGTVYHGTRPVPPETNWSWTSTPIDCEGFSLLQWRAAEPFVSGTGRDEVYTAVCGNVYRLNRNAPVGDAGLDGGPASLGDRWELDYSVEGGMFGGFTGVTATNTGDIWFAGLRSASYDTNECVLLIRKSSDGYTTLIDGVPSPGASCVAKPGVAVLDGHFGDVHAAAKDVVVAALQHGYLPTRHDDELLRLTLVDGDVQVARASTSGTFAGQLSSVWGASEDDLWVIGGRGSDVGGLVLRATSVWDGGAFAFSTLAINGSPNTQELFRIRGTSNQNIWAVGKNSAYFKSTP